MKKIVLTTVALVTALNFSGCSSYPETAESVAQAVCEKAKVFDLDGIFAYATPEFVTKTNEFFEKNPDRKERAKKGLANINCETITKSKTRSNGEKKIYFGRFDIKLVKMDNQWRVRKF